MPFWLFVLFPAVLWILALSWYEPGGVFWSVPWISSTDFTIRFGFNLDPLSILFVSLICGIGILVQSYAIGYMRGKAGRFSFHLYLTTFMLAMLGLVLSDDLILLFIFWELTTVTSYLLIGFNHTVEKSRKNALQAMLVTGVGGLSLLAGVILLGQIAGTYSLQAIIEQGIVQQHPLFTATLILMLLGAFTKSAQFPFHFWLPGAMAAPTPVSAYLHSATMVKAGVYLLARVAPIYAEHDLWLYSLSIAGGTTMLWSALLAFRQTDIKLVLAYSTVTALGQITFLLAFNAAYAVTAAMLTIVVHAIYKAGFFMVIGNIDKSTGTRELSQLSGLRSIMVMTFMAAILAALSKMGIPPVLGFVGKEYVYKAGLYVDVWATTLLVVVNMLSVAMVLVITLTPFLNRAGVGQTGLQPPGAKPIDKTYSLWLPPLTLGVLSVVFAVAGLDWLQINVINPASQVVMPNSTAVDIKLWEGVNTALILSICTVVVGVILYKTYRPVKAMLDASMGRLPQATQVFQNIVSAVVALSKWQTSLLQSKRLSHYTLMSFTVLALLLIGQLSWPVMSFNLAELEIYELSLAVLLVAAAVTCIFTRSRLLAITSLGMVGFLTTLVFAVYSAPDVAKTQLLVETLVVVFITLIIQHLPRLDSVSAQSVPRRLVNLAIASVIGFTVTLLLIQITASPLDTTLTDFYAENSVPGGNGRNIVNVILVDFRAFDTLGEIIVVVIAAVTAISLLKKCRPV